MPVWKHVKSVGEIEMKWTLPIKIFINSKKREIRFFLLFLLFFFLGQAAHYSVRDYTTPLLVYKLNAQVSSKIINIITPSEKTFVRENVIGSRDFTIRIAEGCEGIEGILLLAAAIFAFPMGFMKKVYGVLAGCLMIYASNLLRIIALYYTLKYKPDMFDTMHIFIGQTFIILVGLAFFIIWINYFGKIKPVN